MLFEEPVQHVLSQSWDDECQWDNSCDQPRRCESWDDECIAQEKQRKAAEAAAAAEVAEEEGNEEEGGSAIPLAISGPLVLASNIYKIMVISLIGLGLQFFLWGYIILDKILDYAIRLSLGLVFKPLAWLAIWAFKLPTFPIIIMGWVWRILIELLAFPLAGWMVPFGAGCFLRWGPQCSPFTKKFDERSYWEIADLPFFVATDPLRQAGANAGLIAMTKAHFAVPAYKDFTREEYIRLSDERREMINEASPFGISQGLAKDIKYFAGF